MTDQIKTILERHGIDYYTIAMKTRLQNALIEICEEQKKQCRHSVLVKIDSNLLGANKVLDLILNSKNIAE